ncbi:MAG: TraR/DksA family transcriptional regulator [bacterium]
MTATMIDPEYFRTLIQQRLDGLIASLEQDSKSTETVELDQTRVGRLSRMDAMQMQQMELALSRRQQGELLGLKRALKRLDDGDYGECLECGEPIDPRRLEIDPIASLCISCAQRNET